jgi:outer membrane protein OmpA-like peptidoglycan-associated protein
MHLPRLFLSCSLVTALALSGCATKKHVRSKVQPLEIRIDKLEEKSRAIETSAADIERTASRADERAKSADARATEANAAAGKASEKAGEADNKAGVARSLAQSSFDKSVEIEKRLNSAAPATDEMHVVSRENVYFGINSAAVTKDAQGRLDQAGAKIGRLKRYEVEVQGFADRSGSAARNLELSQKRADSVARYLSSKYNVPVYRLHVMGMGVSEGKSTEAKRMGRRVEVRVLSPEGSATTVSGAR